MPYERNNDVESTVVWTKNWEDTTRYYLMGTTVQKHWFTRTGLQTHQEIMGRNYKRRAVSTGNLVTLWPSNTRAPTTATYTTIPKWLCENKHNPPQWMTHRANLEVLNNATVFVLSICNCHYRWLPNCDASQCSLIVVWSLLVWHFLWHTWPVTKPS